jgi:hypothetical protein
MRLPVIASLGATLLLAACEPSPVPPPLAVVVFNFSHTNATFAYQAPGLLGTPVLGHSESWTIPPCDDQTYGFWDAQQTITITTPQDATTFVLPRPADARTPPVTYAIGSDGHITKVDPSTMPANPTCRP